MSRPKRTTVKVTPYTRNGRVYLRVRPPAGTGRESLQPVETDDAAKEAAELEARINAALAAKAAPLASDPKVMDVFRRHVEFRSSDPLTSPGTVRCYLHSARPLDTAFGALHASALDRGSLLEARKKLVQQGRVSTSVNQLLGRIAHAWSWATDGGLVAVPWPQVDSLPEKRTERRAVAPHELEALLREARAHAGGRHLPLFLLLGDLGSRIGETVRLRGRDVDRAASVVTFRRDTTKGRRARSCAVSPEVLALLPDRGPDALLFPSPKDPARHFSERGALAALHVMLERAGLADEPLVLHSLRGYFVRKLHTAGVPLKDAMDFVGHRSVRVHLGYMEGASGPSQHAMQASARDVHNPLVSLEIPGLGGFKSSARLASPIPVTSTNNGPAHGEPEPSDAPRSPETGLECGDEPGRSRTIQLGTTPEARALAELLHDLPEPKRRAIVHLAADERLQLGVLKAALQHWPQDLPAKAETPAQERQA